MAVVAPVSAIGAAVLPILVGVVLGERPSPLAWAGIALALPAIWLVTRPASDDEAPEATAAPRGRWFESDLVDGLLAGAGFALLFIGLDRAGESGGLWPVVAGELAAIVALGIASIGVLRAATTIAWRAEARTASTAVVAGLLGGVASSAYFLATHDGLLSIVAVVASLYPAVTVVLAALVLREPIGRWQLVGLAAAILALAAIVAG
jgi:drug/metabolite transporter (DMT)-like permease